MNTYQIQAFFSQIHDKLYLEGRLSERYTLKFNNNKTRAGVCFFPPKCTIELSREFIAYHGTTEESIKDVVLHELAHAITGPHVSQPHGKEWKRAAKEIGCSGKRCSTTFKPDYKYLLTCPKGCKIGRHRCTNKSVKCVKHGNKVVIYKLHQGVYTRKT